MKKISIPKTIWLCLLVFGALYFSFAGQGDANRTIYKNRLMPPHLFESALNLRAAQEFTSPGTWYRDPGVEFVLALVAAGGGGSAGAVDGGTRGSSGSGGGVQIDIVDVRGASSETVTIGSGGAGGTYANGAGAAGGASSFGALLTATGGPGGSVGLTQPGGVKGGGPGRLDIADGFPGVIGAGGTASGSAGGGGGSYGVGANGGDVAAANTGGGGGGVGGGLAGKAGGSGYVKIIPIITTTVSVD